MSKLALQTLAEYRFDGRFCGAGDDAAVLAPEASNALGLGERRAVYSMLGFRVGALRTKSLRVRGAFGGENLVWEIDAT